MTEDWAAVAEAINTRLADLGMTQHELATRSGVSPATVRQIQRNYSVRRRSPRTLSALSEALRWPSMHLAEVCEGRASRSTDRDVNSNAATLEDLSREVGVLRKRLDAVEQRLGER